MADLPEKIWILAFRARKYSDEEWPDWSFVSDPSVCLEFPSGREVDSPYFQCLAVEYKRDPIRVDAKAAFAELPSDAETPAIAYGVSILD